VIKREILPDGRVKMILKDPATGDYIDRIIAGVDVPANLDQLESLCDTMQHGSLCGLGGMTPFPVMSAVKHFPADFSRDR
jgi:formate dehydrogenase iron-sulfur subunit